MWCGKYISILILRKQDKNNRVSDGFGRQKNILELVDIIIKIQKCHSNMNNCNVMGHKYDIAVVVPVYGCESALNELCERLDSTLRQLVPTYQIILVNDQSPDDSWPEIVGITQKNNNVLGINLSRNFGQHAAITAGLDRVSSEWVVVMDCDLQDVPEEIAKLYSFAIAEKLDIVFGQRISRRDTLTKRFASFLFHKAFEYLSGVKQDASIANFGIFNYRVINALQLLREPVRAFPIQLKWLGFRRGAVAVAHAKREHGKSGYSLSRQVSLALNIIFSFSDKPLQLIAKLGGSMSLLSLLSGLLLFLRYKLTDVAMPIYYGMIINMWFLSGLIIFAVGIVALYIGKTFEAVKGRPLYLIQSETPFVPHNTTL